mgnify:CR=1 FL=1
MLAPTIFMVGLSGVFGEAAQLPGFDATDFRTYIVPVGLIQGAGVSKSVPNPGGTWEIVAPR